MFIYFNNHWSLLLLPESCFNLFLNQLTCVSNLRCPLWMCSLNLSPSPRGSSCAFSVCRYTLTFHLWSLEGIDYAFGLSCCFKSSECWLIHLCMCNMFCKVQCLGDILIVMHWLGALLEPCIIKILRVLVHWLDRRSQTSMKLLWVSVQNTHISRSVADYSVLFYMKKGVQ